MATSSESNSRQMPCYWSLEASVLSHTCLHFQRSTCNVKIVAVQDEDIFNTLGSNKINGEPSRRASQVAWQWRLQMPMQKIRGSGRSPGEGNGNPLQYSCLGNPMERGAWWATVHGLTKESDTTLQLNNNSKKKLKCTELQFYIKSNISQSENTQSPLYHIILFHYLFSFYHYQKLLTHLFHVWIYLLVVVSTT